MKAFKREYISIGGWCGTAFGLKGSKLRNCSLPFDWVRSKFEAIIDCIENDFANFFPNPVIREKLGNLKAYRGKSISFFHDNLKDITEIEKLKRRITRFDKLLTETQEIVFVRTTHTVNYEDEIKFTKKFHDVMKRKYPNTNYILVFVIPEQKTTQFVKKIDAKTLCFVLNDLSHKLRNLGEEYRPIFNYIENNNIYEDLPQSNIDIELKSRFFEYGGKPTFTEE